MHMRIGDGIRRGRDAAEIRLTIDRPSFVPPVDYRHFGTTTTNARRGADAEGRLVAAALAGATRGVLWPWRHHALLRDTSRPGDALNAKKGGQFDSTSCGGSGFGIPFTWCLRELVPGLWFPPTCGSPLAHLTRLCGSGGLPHPGLSTVSCRRSARMRETACGREESSPPPDV